MDATAGHIGERRGEAGAGSPPAALPDFAKGPVIVAALVLAALLIAFSPTDSGAGNSGEQKDLPN